MLSNEKIDHSDRAVTKSFLHVIRASYVPCKRDAVRPWSQIRCHRSLIGSVKAGNLSFFFQISTFLLRRPRGGSAKECTLQLAQFPPPPSAWSFGKKWSRNCCIATAAPWTGRRAATWAAAQCASWSLLMDTPQRCLIRCGSWSRPGRWTLGCRANERSALDIFLRPPQARPRTHRLSLILPDTPPLAPSISMSQELRRFELIKLITVWDFYFCQFGKEFSIILDFCRS